MKNRNAYMAVVAAMTLCGLGLTSCDSTHWITERQQSTGTELEFVCYDDGALVERHVGVAYANRRWDSVAWEIEYEDGQEAWYQQPPGETCQVEQVSKLPSS